MCSDDVSAGGDLGDGGEVVGLGAVSVSAHAAQELFSLFPLAVPQTFQSSGCPEP